VKLKSKLHSLTLVLLASASTLALAQGTHIGGSGATGGALQRPAITATPSASATPANVTAQPVPATPAASPNGAQTATSGNAQVTTSMPNGNAQGTTSNATHGAADAAASGAGATMAAAKALEADDIAKSHGNSAAAHASHKKVQKVQHHASPVSSKSDASQDTSTDASVSGGASAKTDQ
jgi:hypothetical protein